MSNSLVRLTQGFGDMKGNNESFFIPKNKIPKGNKATRIRIVCEIRVHETETLRVRIEAGGNLSFYPGKVYTCSICKNNKDSLESCCVLVCNKTCDN